MGQGELEINVNRVPSPAEKVGLAKDYGTTVRTLDRIVKRAKEVGSIPNFWDAAELEDWVRTYTGRKASHWLELAASKVEKPTDPKSEMPVQRAAVDLANAEESGDMGLGLMRRLVTVASQGMAKAYEKGDALEIREAEGRFERLTKNLQIMEKTAVNLEKAGGDLVSKEKIATQVVRQAQRLASVMESELEKFFAEYFPDENREKVKSRTHELRDRVFRAYKVELPS